MKRKPLWRRFLCFISIHEWRSYEEAVALGTAEACKHCVGWRFVGGPRHEA